MKIHYNRTIIPTLTKISFITLFSLVLSSAEAKKDDNNKTLNSESGVADEVNSKLEVDVSSREVFSQLMSEPLFFELFRKAQLDRLSDPIDQLVREFITSTPELRKIYNVALSSLTNELKYFEYSANVQMLKLTSDGVTEQYSRLYNNIQKTAKDLGFSPEAINNMSVYIKNGSGSFNAFTVSGSQDKIIIVIHSELIKGMTEQEVRSVVAHELGHIRASHPVTGYVMNVLFKILSNTFTGEQNNEFANLRKGFFLDNDDSIEQHNRLKNDLEQKLKFKNTPFGLNRNSLGEEIATVISKIPDDGKRKLFDATLELCIKILKKSEAPSESISFFMDLKKHLLKTAVKVNPEQFNDNLSILGDRVSQGREKTADHHSSGTSQNSIMASAIAKLMGLVYEKSERDKVLSNLIRQADEFIQNTPVELQPYFSGESHPSEILRINNILNFNTVPDIFFANPMLRFLVLEKEINQQITMINQMLNEHNIQMNDEIKQRITVMKAEFETKHKDLTTIISSRILDMEKKILPEDSSKNVLPRDHRNPRFDNLIQFLTVIKESQYDSLEKMQLVLLELKKQPQKKSIQKQIAGLEMEINNFKLEISTFGSELLNQVEHDYKIMLQNSNLSSFTRENVVKRLEMLKVAQLIPTNENDLEKIIHLRFEATKLSGNRTKGSRIPMSCQMVFK